MPLTSRSWSTDVNGPSWIRQATNYQGELVLRGVGDDRSRYYPLVFMRGLSVASPTDPSRYAAFQPTPEQPRYAERRLPSLFIIWFNIVALGWLLGLGLIYGYYKAIQGVRRTRERGLSPQRYIWPMLFWPIVLVPAGIIYVVTGGPSDSHTDSAGVSTSIPTQHSQAAAPTSSLAGHQFALAAFDVGTVSLPAGLTTDGKLQIDATLMPTAGPGFHYEVWLTSADRTREMSVGTLEVGKVNTYNLTQSQISQYAAIEISVQATGGIPDYSGRSTNRGTY